MPDIKATRKTYTRYKPRPNNNIEDLLKQNSETLPYATALHDLFHVYFETRKSNIVFYKTYISVDENEMNAAETFLLDKVDKLISVLAAKGINISVTISNPKEINGKRMYQYCCEIEINATAKVVLDKLKEKADKKRAESLKR